jgi:prolyl oligopeptidase
MTATNATLFLTCAKVFKGSDIPFCFRLVVVNNPLYFPFEDFMDKLLLCGLLPLALLTTTVRAALPPATMPATDPYLWLEQVTSPQSLDWVKAQNALTTEALEHSPVYADIRARYLSILNSDARIPAVHQYGKYLYNFWQDAQHTRGIWRRTTMPEYKKADPAWETVLDLDALAATEKENWTWKGETVFEPEGERCLLSLSRGGADADTIREFDMIHKTFVPNGFQLPEAKSSVAWHDLDTLYVGTDFGPGSTTSAGYPRIIKEWHRGTPLASAKTLFEGQPTDVEVAASTDFINGVRYEFIDRGISFFQSELRLRVGDQWVKIDRPTDAAVEIFNAHILISLKTPWIVAGKTYPSGALIAENLAAFLHGDRSFSLLFDPADGHGRRSIESIEATHNFLILNELDNVNGRIEFLHLNGEQWSRTLLDTPRYGSASAYDVDSNTSDDYFLDITDFLTPSTLFLGTAGTPDRQPLKALPAFFNTAGLDVQQHEATSKDGTKIPYFQVGPKNLILDGSHPTLQYAYGGFQISESPVYSAGVGVGWLERGGVYVLANIRGGGEFGPEWHEAARKENRQRAYDDFIAVAEDLIARKVTSPAHLGIQGGSNGGLLMGVMLTERPDLWGAVLCQAPLLDMKRYSHLLAGASWIDEYGDPDTAEGWAYLSKYSPYQNVKPGVKYPPVLFMTSTRDDRVHPGHARKMAALMESMGNNVLFYENTEGGHAGAVNNNEIATSRALGFSFLWKNLR